MTAPRLSNPPTGQRRKHALRVLKTVPILPSLVTLGNVFFGFLAIAKAADAITLSAGQGVGISDPEVIHLLQVSALLIFVAMVFDALDGAVARMTRQTSQFGAQLDSMADMVTFGVAPAFLAKVLIDFHTQGDNPVVRLQPKIIYVAVVVYVLCTTMRLARFNAEIPSDSAEDHQEFSGLPSPAAAAVIAAMLTFFCFLMTVQPDDSVVAWMKGHDVELWIVRALPVCLVVLGLLMVSRLPYPHVVVSLLRSGHSFPFLASVVVLVVLLALEWEIGLLGLVSCYILCGIVLGAYRLITRGRIEQQEPDFPEDPSDSPRRPSLN